MTKIAIIGAGSHFGGKLSRDVLALPELQDAQIALCDINKERLDPENGFLLAAHIDALFDKGLISFKSD